MTLLQYDIRVIGAANVDKALAGIEARIRMHNQRVAHMTGVTPAQARRATSPGGAQATARQFQGAAAAHFKAVGREQVAAEKAVTRERAKALREDHRLRNQINNMNLRAVKTEERERVRALAHEHRVHERMAHARTHFLQQSAGRGFERASNTVRTVGMAGAAMLGVGGAALAASAVSGATKLDETTRRLIISGRGAGEASKFQPDELRKRFEQTGIETGLAPEDIAGGVQKFVTKVGDLDTAVANMKVFATVAQATNSSIEDIASSAADLSEKLGIKSVEDMSKALATLTFQGKKGAFELRDMAQYLPEITAAASTFGVRGVSGITSLGGMMQIARRATGSGAEASTSMEAMFRQMTAKSTDIQSGDAFSGRKVSVFEGNDPTKPLRDFNEILGDMISASRGNLVQLQDVFDVRGIRAVNPLITTFREASGAAGGGDKGAKAGRDAVMAALKAAAIVQGEYSDVQKDAADAMKATSVQWEIIGTRLKQQIADRLFPEIERLIPKVAELVPYVGRAAEVFVDFVKALSDHPFGAVITLIGAQIVGDIAKARIGGMVGDAIAKAIQGKGILPPGGPGASGTPGASGFSPAPGAMSVLGKAMPVVQAVTESTDRIRAGLAANYGGEVEGSIERARQLQQAIEGGDTSQTPAALQQLQGLQGMASGAERARGEASTPWGELFGDTKRLGQDLFGSGGAQNQAELDKAALANNEAILSAIKDLAASLGKSDDKIGAAATKLDSAAGKIASAPLNRSPNPSTVK